MDIPHNIQKLYSRISRLKQGLRSSSETELTSEAEAAIADTEQLLTSMVGDIEGFRKRCEIDRDTFAWALRLKENDMIARQLMWAADELKVEISKINQKD